MVVEQGHRCEFFCIQSAAICGLEPMLTTSFLQYTSSEFHLQENWLPNSPDVALEQNYPYTGGKLTGDKPQGEAFIIPTRKTQHKPRLLTSENRGCR